MMRRRGPPPPDAPLSPPPAPRPAVFPCTGFAGTVNRSFWNPPRWVDASLPPGTTSQQAAYCPSPQWYAQLLTGYSLLFSPNLVWLAIALLDYALFPYDFDAAALGFRGAWISKRLVANAALALGYTGFWHVALYWLGRGRRPFKQDRVWSWGKFAHNLWYSCLGVAQWTGFEVLFMRAYATGRLPYLTDAAAFGSPAGLLNFVASCFWVPMWRTFHFYFTHRLLHIRPLYKFVHSLHHRNTDVEPFAGLCMHPVEHLYYFACIAPSLYVFCSPFAFMWNGVHLLISPAASHSGYEDHFQSDQFHYLHHKYFECNYGPTDCPLDRWFGTFRDKMTASTASPGEASSDAKANLVGIPEASFICYMLCAVVFPLAVLVQALGDPSSVASWAFGPLKGEHSVALICATSPVIAGALGLVISGSTWLQRPRQSFVAPFHKEAVLGALGMHLALGVAVTIVPVYHMIHMVLAPPGHSFYCSLHGC